MPNPVEQFHIFYINISSYDFNFFSEVESIVESF